MASNKVVRAVHSVTRSSPYAAFTKLISRKTAKSKSARNDQAKSIRNWKKSYPMTVKAQVKNVRSAMK